MHRQWFLLSTLLFGTAQLSAESISGTVTDPGGRPVPGIRLLLFRAGELHAQAVSDGMGYYSFEDLTQGLCVIAVRNLGFRQNRIEVLLRPQEEVEQPIILELKRLREEVVVTGARTETASSLLGNSLTVIPSEEIEAQGASNVAEVLRNVPAVNILQLGGKGSLTTLFLRGGESDYTKVLLDGVPLNQPGGSIDLSNLSTANVQRIEIVRGPQSALYGSDAISGVIQIFTKKGSTEAKVPRFDGFLEGGNLDTFRAGTAIRGGSDRLSYSAEFQHFSTNNMEVNDFFHNSSFSLHLGVETSKHSTLTLLGRSERGRSGAPGPTAFGRPDLEEFSRKRDFLTAVAWEQQISSSWEHKISYSQSYVNQLSEDAIDSGPFLPQFEGREAAFSSFDFPFSFLSATRRHNVNYQSDFFVSAHLLSAGFDYEEQQGVVGEVRASRTNLGYYIQDQFLVAQRFAITGGLRIEDNGSFGFAATPRFSLAYLLRNGEASEFWGMTRPKFNFGLGIKEPTFVESFSTNFFFQGNPDLEPERTRSFEIGLEQTMAQSRVRAELNLFHNHFENQVAFQTVDFETFEGSFFNIGESRSWGIEQVLEVRAEDSFSISTGYTYLNSKVLESTNPFSPVFQEGARLLLRPTHSGFLALSWIAGDWKVHSNVTLIGNRADSDFLGIGLTEVDGFAKWDISGSYRVAPRLELYLVAENILNQEYFEVIGFQALKFHFRSGVRFGF